MFDRFLKSLLIVPGWRSGCWVVAAAAMTLGVSGCLSPSRGIQDLRLPRYRPDTDRRGEWFDALHPQADEPAVEPSATEPAPVPADPSVPAGIEPAPVPADPSVPAGTEGNVAGGPGIEASSPLRTIMSGDRLTIMVDGPEPQKFEDVVDDRDCVRLPHIGEVRVAGKTTSQVEDAIERAYIDGHIYKYVNVTVVSLDDEFFIRGEVKREGRFALTGAMTLGKAITVAGGFTEYARRGKVEIQRGNEILPFDMDRIYGGKDADPLLRRGDQVYVPRRFM